VVLFYVFNNLESNHEIKITVRESRIVFLRELLADKPDVSFFYVGKRLFGVFVKSGEFRSLVCNNVYSVTVTGADFQYPSVDEFRRFEVGQQGALKNIIV